MLEMPSNLYLVGQVIGIGVLSVSVIFCLHTRLKKKPSLLSQTSGIVLSVSISSQHVFSKSPRGSITLLTNLGVEGDCHCGTTVQHLARLHVNPPPPNLRQVHLIQSELFLEFQSSDADGKKYVVRPGELGENITTSGLDLLSLGARTRLHFVNPGRDEKVDHAVVRVTGLRNPCPQISKFQSGLQERCLVRNEGREIVERKAGVMSVVEVGGVVMKGARVVVEKPETYEALLCV